MPRRASRTIRAPGSRRLPHFALEALASRGEAFTSDITRADPLLATKLRLGAGTRWEVQPSAASRVLPLLAAEGAVVRGRPRGTWTNGQYRWALAPERGEALDTPSAQAELLRHWLLAFGPATETDVRWWTGWTAREARAALAAVPHVAVDLDGAPGIALAGDLDPTAPAEPTAALLPTLDPTTMGWKEREWYLGPHGKVLFDSTAMPAPPCGGTGASSAAGRSGRTARSPSVCSRTSVPTASRAIEAEAQRLAAWLGDVRFSPSFLPPFQRALAR